MLEPVRGIPEARLSAACSRSRSACANRSRHRLVTVRPSGARTRGPWLADNIGRRGSGQPGTVSPLSFRRRDRREALRLQAGAAHQ